MIRRAAGHGSGDRARVVWVLRSYEEIVRRRRDPALVTLAIFDEVDELCETSRGAGGFGSTGQ